MRRPLALATLLLVAALAWGVPVRASELDEAIRAGAVGERFDGYLGTVAADPSPASQRLVAEINARRRQEYAAIAARNGVPVEAVAQISGKKLVERAAPGTHVMLPDGRWLRK